MKKYFFVVVLVFTVMLQLFSQNLVTLDEAINDYAIGLMKNVEKDKGVAVIAFETNKINLAVYFIDTMTEKLWEKGIRPIYERQRLEVLQKELNYSLSGDVSDETALRVGKRTGVNTVVYGSLQLIGNNNYRISIRATNVETAQIIFPKSYDLKMNPRLAGLLGISSNVQNQPNQEQSYNTNYLKPQKKLPETSMMFYLDFPNIGFATIFDLEVQLGLQVGVAIEGFNFLFDLDGGFGVTFDSDQNIRLGIEEEYYLSCSAGGMFEYKFPKSIGLGIGGGIKNYTLKIIGSDGYFPYIRGLIHFCFDEGIRGDTSGFGLYFDYYFLYGVKFGICLHYNIDLF